MTVIAMVKRIKEANITLKKFNVMIKFNAEYNEYRVNFIGGKEATAYYTNDIEDAIDTGKAMGTNDPMGDWMGENK